LIVVAVVIVGLVAALLVIGLSGSDSTSLNAYDQSAIAAGQGFALDVATYDYRHLHRDFAKVEAEATPSFRRTFIQSSGGLSKVLLQYHATAKAKALSAGLVSIDASDAVVIVFLNQTVTNTAQKGSTTDNSRIEVTLLRYGNGWLLQKLKLL
jgi:Mce-associated membrane protein